MSKFGGIWAFPAVALALAAAGPALAQESPAAAEQTAPAIDPATIQVPDLRFTPSGEDVANYHKYFFYHKPGISFERARADWEECYSYLAGPGALGLPAYITLSETPAGPPLPQRDAPYRATNYGVIGALIGNWVAGGIEFRARQSKLRMCMGFKNYTRYGASKPLWERITAGGPERAIPVLARIASGPPPAGEALKP